jgi:hypothetical protein
MLRNQFFKHSEKFINFLESLFWFISKFLWMKYYLVNWYYLCFCAEKSALQVQKWLLLLVIVTYITCQILWGIIFSPFLYPFHIFISALLFQYFISVPCPSCHHILPPSFPSLFHVKTPASPQFFHTFINFIPSSPSLHISPIFLSSLSYVYLIAICFPCYKIHLVLDLRPMRLNDRRQLRPQKEIINKWTIHRGWTYHLRCCALFSWDI